MAGELLLLECRVAGTTDIEDVLIKTQDVEAGAQLVLRLVCDGSHSISPIAVFTEKGERIGSVPTRPAMMLARLMERGKRLVARVVAKRLEGHLLTLHLAIYMDEL